MEGEQNLQVGKHLETHVIANIVAGVCTGLAVIVSALGIYSHLAHYREPNKQRLVIRILLMVPIYSIDSFLSLVFKQYAVYFDLLRDAYEGYVVYSFLGLLILFLGGRTVINEDILATKAPLPHPKPLCCLAPLPLANSTFLLRVRQGALQFAFIKPLLAVISLAMEWYGVFHDGQLTNHKGGYLYITVLSNFSVTLSMYCLLLFYTAVHDELLPFKPLPKFLCIKSVIFFSFWQGVVVALLVKVHFIHQVGAWTADDVATGLQDFLICVEMFFAALLHRYAFPAEMFEKGTGPVRPFLTNIQSAMSVKDVLRETAETLQEDPLLGALAVPGAAVEGGARKKEVAQEITDEDASPGGAWFSRSLAAVVFFSVALLAVIATIHLTRPVPIKPLQLQSGGIIAFVSPASPPQYDWHHNVSDYKRHVVSSLEGMGFQVCFSSHSFDEVGYLAGTDEDRAADLNAMFADPSVVAIVANRGGWGTQRLLPYLDWSLLRANPKVIIGYSDVTALLNAAVVRAGVVAYHGPMGLSNWTNGNGDFFMEILSAGQKAVLSTPSGLPLPLVTLHSGKASGRLVGGNMATFSALVGSAYLPSDFTGKILFLEEVEEPPRKIDRMFAQLDDAGVLDAVEGFVFGQCSGCVAPDPTESLSLNDVLEKYFKDRGVPACSGAMFGHIPEQFTLPLGTKVTLDANSCTLVLDEPAVKLRKT